MAQILRGKEVAMKLKEEIKNEVSDLNKIDKFPTLSIVRLGDDPSDISYEKSIIKNCDEVGIKTKVFENDLNITTEELIELISKLNDDDDISGMIVFRPLPKHIDEEKIKTSIKPSKDVDCMHPLNLARIFEGDMDGMLPATPKAAMEILAHYDVDLEGKNVVIVNRSTVVGKPLAMMMLEENATVIVCHSRTKDLKELTKKADVVVPALGKAKYFTNDYFTKDSIIIDVGMSMDDDGKLSGDVDYENVVDNVKMITPVPGGVGAVTTTILLDQVIRACKNN